MTKNGNFVSKANENFPPFFAASRNIPEEVEEKRTRPTSYEAGQKKSF